MALVGPFDRTSLLVPGPPRTGRPDESAPPTPCRRPRPGRSPSAPSVARQRSVAEFLVPTLLAESTTVSSVLGRLEACLDEEVVAWSPSMLATSRTALVTALVHSDDALSDVSVSIENLFISGADLHAEWALTARFAHAAFLDDDILVEPSGRIIESAGMMTLGFIGSRVGSIRCYYDGLALLEQVVGHGTPDRDASSD
jgi:hypothetical protein